jgi:hypothetical protein
VIATVRAYPQDGIATTFRAADTIAVMKSQEPIYWAGEKPSQSVLPPNGQGKPIYITPTTSKMPAADFRYAMAAEWGWVLATETTYSDSYGNDYQAGMCIYHRADGQAGTCPIGNYEK